MSIKVIGAGFGRTGTASLKTALEHLGFGHCYHMYELGAHPDHVPYWESALAGKPTDWDALFTGYSATVDWPGCTFYKELMTAYPDAKVILSVRDPERWFESANKTIFNRPLWMRLAFRLVSALRLQQGRTLRLIRDLIPEGTFDGRPNDRAHAIRTFNAHNDEVRRTVPPEKLLVYEVKEGWEPLCHFLGVPVPEVPFPRQNSAAGFRAEARVEMRRIRERDREKK